jgi:hypothetical protein
MYRDTKKRTSDDEPWLVLGTVHIACERTTIEKISGLFRRSNNSIVDSTHPKCPMPI